MGSGDVYLTAGLVDAATEDEIAATIAHEMGHLVKAQGATHSEAAGLNGNGTSLSVEQRADAAGIAVLQRTSRPPAALLSLLTKVHATSASADSKEEIQKRIDLLRSHLAM